MNRYNKDVFTSIKKSAENYQHECGLAFLKFRQNMAKATEEAGQYKDEASYLTVKKAGFITAARNAVKTAEAVFQSEVAAELPGLKEELMRHLATRPNASFLEALDVYRSYHIQPSRLEIEALLKQSGGSTLSLRALNSVLEEVKSDYRISFPDASAFEADLKFLNRFSQEQFRPFPDDYYTEACAVFNGDRMIRWNVQTESNLDIGYTWDKMALLLAGQTFKSHINQLDEMAGRWSENILPSIVHVEDYMNKAENPAEAVKELASDLKATAEAAKIEKTGTGTAEEYARKRSETEARAAEVRDKYTGKR